MREANVPTDENIVNTRTATGAPKALPISLFGIANIALRRWRIFLILPPVAFVVAMVISYVKLDQEPRATAKSRVFAKGSGGGGAAQPSGAAGLVSALLGESGNTGSGGGGPAMFTAILTSTEFLRELAAMKFRVDTAKVARFNEINPTVAPSPTVIEGTIARLYGRGGDSATEVRVGAGLLKGMLAPRLGSDAGGLTTLTTTARWPDLAVQLNYRVMELLDKHDTRIRRSQIAVERRFLKERMAAAMDDVSRAEAELATFIERNRSIGQSPYLSFERSRLQSRLDLYQGTFTSLRAQDEAQRLEEARNTPVITIFDRPEYFVTQAEPATTSLTDGWIGLMLGLAAVVLWVFGVEFLKILPRSDPDEYARFRQLSRSIALSIIPARLRWRNGAMGEAPQGATNGKAEITAPAPRTDAAGDPAERHSRAL